MTIDTTIIEKQDLTIQEQSHADESIRQVRGE